MALNISAFAGISRNTQAKVSYPNNPDANANISTDPLNGIDKNNGLVIVFPEGLNYVQLEGNQGVGKTSLIECLKEAAGGLATSNTVNLSHDTEGLPVLDKKYGERFWGNDGCLYQLKVTKTTITLERIETDQDGNPILDKRNREISSIMKEPKTLLQKIIGPAGISPLSMKNMSGPDQVKWLRSLYNLGTDAETFEYNLKKNYQQAFDARTLARRQHNTLLPVLNANTYHTNYEKWQAYFQTTKPEALQQSVATVTKRKKDYDKGVDLIPQIAEGQAAAERDVTDLEEQMARLLERLNVKKELVQTYKQRMVAGKKYLDDNKDVPAEYEAISGIIKEITDYGTHKAHFEAAIASKKEVDHLEGEIQRLDGLVNELAKTKKEYIKQFSPDIPDFEVRIAEGIGDRNEGIFYKGKPLVHLAESEMWEIATMLWRALNVKIIYVENVNSLGTGAIEKFNQFLETGGCYIFGTKMNRSEDNLKISFHTNIPME